MMLTTQKAASSGQQLMKSISDSGVAAAEVQGVESEPCLCGSYLEAWFRCLQLSKQYTHNCRTGLFGSQGAANTFQLFGSVEDCTLQEWWCERGCENFGRSMATFKVRLVVAQRKKGSCRITLDADDETPAGLVGDEISFMVYQLRLLQGQCGMLSAAPKAWSILQKPHHTRRHQAASRCAGGT